MPLTFPVTHRVAFGVDDFLVRGFGFGMQIGVSTLSWPLVPSVGAAHMDPRYQHDDRPKSDSHNSEKRKGRGSSFFGMLVVRIYDVVGIPSVATMRSSSQFTESVVFALLVADQVNDNTEYSLGESQQNSTS
jgi:hypothetical protein